MINKKRIIKLGIVFVVLLILSAGFYSYAETVTEIPKKAQEHYEKALKDLSKRDFKSAEKNLIKSLEECPDYFDALKEMGKLKAMTFLGNVQRDPEYAGEEGTQALEYLVKAAEINEKDYEVYKYLSQLYTIGYLEDITLAKENIMRALALEKSDIIMYDFALSLMDPKIDMGYLMSLYKDLVDIEPDNTDNLVQYFAIAHSLNETDEMIWALEKIVEKNPEGLQDMRNLAVLYIQSNNKEKSLKTFENLEKLAGDDLDILNVITKGLIHFEEYEKALTTVEKEYKINPDDLTIVYDYAFILENLERADEAIDKYKLITDSEDGKNKDKAMRSLINIYLDKGEFELAKTYCEKYITDFPDDKLIEDVKDILEEIKEGL